MLNYKIAPTKLMAKAAINCFHAVTVAESIVGNRLCGATKMTNAVTKSRPISAHIVHTKPNKEAISACMCANIIRTSQSSKVAANAKPFKAIRFRETDFDMDAAK